MFEGNITSIMQYEVYLILDIVNHATAFCADRILLAPLPRFAFFLVVDKVLFLPDFCYTYVKLYTDFEPALESYPGTALTMRTAF